MRACETSWRPTRPSSRGNLPALFPLPVQARVRRSLRRTMSISKWMMNYPPAVPRFHAVHHPRAPQKPIQEKGHLIEPAALSVLQDVRCEENTAGTNDHQRQLANMWLTGHGASPHQRRPYTRHTGPPHASNNHSLRYTGTTGHALHSPWTAYTGLRSSPRLFHAALCHVRRFIWPV